VFLLPILLFTEFCLLYICDVMYLLFLPVYQLSRQSLNDVCSLNTVAQVYECVQANNRSNCTQVYETSCI